MTMVYIVFFNGVVQNVYATPEAATKLVEQLKDKHWKAKVHYDEFPVIGSAK